MSVRFLWNISCQKSYETKSRDEALHKLPQASGKVHELPAPSGIRARRDIDRVRAVVHGMIRSEV